MVPQCGCSQTHLAGCHVTPRPHTPGTPRGRGGSACSSRAGEVFPHFAGCHISTTAPSLAVTHPRRKKSLLSPAARQAPFCSGGKAPTALRLHTQPPAAQLQETSLLPPTRRSRLMQLRNRCKKVTLLHVSSWQSVSAQRSGLAGPSPAAVRVRGEALDPRTCSGSEAGASGRSVLAHLSPRTSAARARPQGRPRVSSLYPRTQAGTVPLSGDAVRSDPMPRWRPRAHLRAEKMAPPELCLNNHHKTCLPIFLPRNNTALTWRLSADKLG